MKGNTLPFMLRGIKDLVDKAVKLLAISGTKVIPVTVKVETSSPG